MYEIISSNSISNIINEKNVIFLGQSQHDFSAKYLRSNGNILVTFVKGGQAILFENEKECEKVFAHFKRWPIEEITPNVFQLDQEYINNLPDSLLYFIRILRGYLKTHIDESIIDVKYIENISKQIRGYVNKNKHIAYNRIYVAIGVYIHNLIRIKSNGEWKLIKEYRINPYNIPIVIVGDKEYNCWGWILKEMGEKRSQISIMSILTNEGLIF